MSPADLVIRLEEELAELDSSCNLANDYNDVRVSTAAHIVFAVKVRQLLKEYE